jgi:hypothetical protein
MPQDTEINNDNHLKMAADHTHKMHIVCSYIRFTVPKTDGPHPIFFIS